MLQQIYIVPVKKLKLKTSLVHTTHLATPHMHILMTESFAVGFAPEGPGGLSAGVQGKRVDKGDV